MILFQEDQLHRRAAVHPAAQLNCFTWNDRLRKNYNLLVRHFAPGATSV